MWSRQLGEDHGVAVVDGKGMNTTRLLAAALHQFGFDVDLSSNTELMGLLRVYAMQQAGSGHPPVLIVENTHELNRSALRALCELAEVRVRFGSALKIVLMSDRALAGIINSAAMQAIRERVLHDFHLRPMTCEETRDYVHAKLNAAGAEFPAFVFPKMVCDELWRASGGWPGIVDRIALLAIARAESLPISSEHVERPPGPGSRSRTRWSRLRTSRHRRLNWSCLPMEESSSKRFWTARACLSAVPSTTTLPSTAPSSVVTTRCWYVTAARPSSWT